MRYFWLLSGMVLPIFLIAAEPDSSTVQFREPQLTRYRIEQQLSLLPQSQDWIKAWPTGETNFVEMGSRVVLQLKAPEQLSRIIKSSSLTPSRQVTADVFILQAPDASTAIREASRLSELDGVLSCHPVTRRPADLDGRYAPRPNDYWYDYQWNFEDRYPNGSRYGPDLNLRAAWPYSRGAGTTIAVGDFGVELDHPEFTNRTTGLPHFNFSNGETNGMPTGTSASYSHGTAVAGLAVAAANNSIGVVGVAPEARLASWVIFGTNLLLVDDEKLMDMFQYQSNAVQIQVHSWGNNINLDSLFGTGLLAQIGISNAIAAGRNGRGVIMVRSAGNGRQLGHNANDNAYCSDPRVIGVAATTPEGRVGSLSNPGACLLVAAGGQSASFLFTTDRQGPAGYNGLSAGQNPPQPLDYTFWNYAPSFFGTSASAPQIAGLGALILSLNPNLTYRDVQQILIHSALHFDLLDPDLIANGAGLLVSHNLGFGMPDAGQAVRLASVWPLRPALGKAIQTQTNSASIPDAGLRVWISGDNVPTNLLSIAAAPSTGPHADVATSILPLIDVGLVTNRPSINLTNKAALIQHGGSFSNEITKVAEAGASFAVVFYSSDTGVPPVMAGTDFVPIPAVLIGNTRGLGLRSYLQTNATGMAQIRLNSTNYSFAISETLNCEHVGVRLSFNHPARGDLRVTLTSPQGTRSILQRANDDTNAAPSDWTYWSTHHFYESSAGNWTVSVSDEFPGFTGSVESVQLIVHGVAISDTDHDALDDNWEMTNFSSLNSAPKDDPDKDGYNNAREQILATNPNQAVPLQMDLSPWSKTLARVSWPGSTNYYYEVWSGTNIANLTLTTNVPGRFPETEWFAVYTNAQRFVRIVAKEN